MDPKFTDSKICTQLLPAALALFLGLGFSNGASSALVAETNAGSTIKSSSTIVVTATDQTSASGPSASARGSIAFVVPTAAPKPIAQRAGAPNLRRTTARLTQKPAPTKPASARGDLAIVSQHQLLPLVQPLRSETKEPTAQLANQAHPEKKSRAPQAAGPNGTNRFSNALLTASRKLMPVKRNTQSKKLFKRVRQADHQEPVNAPGPTAELLIEAHTLSLQASRESDYTQILKQAVQAIRMGANQEQQVFSRQLISWSLNRRGRLRANEGQQELAEADFRAAVENNPKNWRALHNRGVSYAQAGSFAEAFDDFNLVTRLNPKYPKAYLNRATLFVQANDLQSALTDYQKAFELDSTLSKARLGMARIQHMLGQWDEALAHFDAAIETDPANAEILCSRGDLLADMGQYHKALAAYAHTVEVNPEFAHAYRNGSWLLSTCPEREFRDAENALMGAQRALKFDYGDRHVALDTLAAAQANAGQFQQAIETLNEALAIAPNQAKTDYHQRMRLYEQNTPFRTEPVGGVAQVAYEATDR